MKHLAQTTALMMFLAMCSGTALAADHEKSNMEGEVAPQSGVDSANDPDDGMGTDPEMKPEGEQAPKSGVDSANDPDDGTGTDPEMQPKEELAPDSGVDSANDPED